MRPLLLSLAAVAVAPTPTPYSYVWRAGSLGSGGDAAKPANYTIAAASRLCTSLPACRGFAYVGNNCSTSAQLTVFKTAEGFRASNASAIRWSTWVKTGVVTPPAMVAPVGASGLVLSLRAGTWTVQGLSVASDPWGRAFSFTRALDVRSALPFGMHLGDVTVRLRSADRSYGPSDVSRGRGSDKSGGGGLDASGGGELGERGGGGLGESGGSHTSAVGGLEPRISARLPQPTPDTAIAQDTCSTAGRTWTTFSTAGGIGDVSASPVPPPAGSKRLLAAHDVTPLLANSARAATLPIRVVRSYEVSADDKALVIRFNVSSTRVISPHRAPPRPFFHTG